MHKIAQGLMAMLLVLLVGGGGYGCYRYWISQTSQVAAPVGNVDVLWQSTLSDVSGKAYPLAQFQGKPAIINFWATWCEPCREEMPAISALATAHPEIVVLGLAIDEAEAVHDFTNTTPVSYPLLIAENEGAALLEAMGDQKGVLPYTVILSAQGQVIQTFFGRVSRQMLEKALNLTP